MLQDAEDFVCHLLELHDHPTRINACSMLSLATTPRSREYMMPSLCPTSVFFCPHARLRPCWTRTSWYLPLPEPASRR